MTAATLTILCEGSTEYNFVVRTLKPHLSRFGVFAKPVDLGGRPQLTKLHEQLNNALQDRRSHLFVTTMIDLYALGSYPGNEKLGKESAEDRVARIEARLKTDYRNPNFIPYIQLHEFEALLLVDVEKFSVYFVDDDIDAKIKKLATSIAGIEPEQVNDQPNTAPSKRIIAAIPEYSLAKNAAGPEIVDAIGLPAIRQRCPHFNSWIARLENLSKSS